MKHRDYIVVKKIVEEIDTASLLMGDVYKTVKDDFPIFRKQLTEILENEEDERI